MKIVHIAPNAPYNENWGYQENLLPKYHRKLGHDVTVIVPNIMQQNGKLIKTNLCDYILDDGVRIIRLEKKIYVSKVLTNLRTKLNVFPYLKEIKPDFIFFHGLLSTTIFDVIKYKKTIKRDCVIVEDNHCDYNNNYNKNKIKAFIIRQYYRILNKKSIKYVSRVYGVTPLRKIYAEKYFKIPKVKTSLLLMGADDEKINFADKQNIRKEIRNKFNIGKQDFLIVTGGKFDKYKKLDILIKACIGLNNVKLLVFGEPVFEYKAEFCNLIAQKNIIYIGWIPSEKVYDYYFAADLICFLGLHSVLWEQACASKTPCLFSRLEGMDHVNNGGNCDFVQSDNCDAVRMKIMELNFTKKYFEMKRVSESSATNIFLYSKIAEKSLECFDDGHIL